jgi:hypothetical protein
MFYLFCGAAVMLGLSALSGSNPSHRVYELRLYHVNIPSYKCHSDSR